MIKKFLFLLLSLGIFLGCSMPDATGNNDKGKARWMQGYGPTRGHEDLTRFAVEKANQLLEDDFFPEVEYGDNGMSTDHPIVEGNYRTDFPDARMKIFYGFDEDLSSSDWQNHPRLMVLHSLRNHNSDGTLQSAIDAYNEWRQYIYGATKQAISVYESGDVEEGLYWFGHSLHMIQDSFAPAHTIRNTKDGSDYKMLNDLNSYGIKVDGVGYHKKIDLDGDRIWASNACWNPSCRDWECLKGEARAASNAGAGYLYMVANILNGNISDIDEGLQKYFDGNINMPFSGYLSSADL